jgi:hypothetical protein
MADPSTTPGSGAPSAKDLAGEFKKMPQAEKILAIAAAVTLAMWAINEGWNKYLFFHNWFITLCLFGPVVVLGLIVTRLLGIRLLEPALYTKVLVLFSVLPALGFVVDAFARPKYAILLAGAIAMGYAAGKIGSREHLIKMN